MGWDRVLTDLLDLLARLYPTPADARDVAERAGLPARFIHFGGSLDNVWMSVLREARKSHDGLPAIVRAAQKDYPGIDFPTLVRQKDEPVLRGPNPTLMTPAAR
jgi:hypothetical protein